jgi:predicted HNH restriction endonuclease
VVNHQSTAWRNRRAKYLRDHKDNLKCSLCDKPAFGKRGGKKYALHLHHLSYDFPVGSEPDCVLRILCAGCHEIVTMINRRRATNTTIAELQMIIKRKLGDYINDISG